MVYTTARSRINFTNLNKDETMEESLIPTVPASRTHLMCAVMAPFLCCLQFGVVIGYSSPAIPNMIDDGMLNESTSNWFASLMTLGGLLGCPLAGFLVEKYGRRSTLFITNAPFFIGWLLIAAGMDTNKIFLGRFLTGLSGGMVTVVTGIYISEVSPVKYRGTLGSGVQLNITLGILAVYLFGCFMEWRSLAIMASLLSILSEMALYFSPETPRYHILKGNKQEAIASLEILRGKDYDCTKECRQIEESMTDLKPVSISTFLSPSLFRPLKLAIGLMLFQQLTGINIVMFYTVSIFKDAGYGQGNSSNIATVGVGVVQMIVTAIACSLMDKLGRRPLLLLSGIGMTISCFALAAFYALPVESRVPFAAVVALNVYIAAFAIGWGPCPMLLNSEIFPLKCRGTATAIATVASWSSAFLITSQFSSLVSVVGGTGGAFAIFGCFGILSLLFVYIAVPETKNKSLEEIENYFRGRAIRK